MPNWIKELCLWPYIAVILILSLTVKTSTAHTNRLNYLKGAEADIHAALINKQPLNVQDLRWAIRYYAELAKKFPDNDIISANKGFCYFQMGDYKKAAAAYEEAIRLRPYIYSHYFDRAIVAWQMREVEGAVNFFIDSLKMIPKTKVIYDNIAQSFQGPKMNDWIVMLSLAMRQMQQDQGEAYQRLMLFREHGGSALEQRFDDVPGQYLHFHSQLMILLSAQMRAKNF